MQQLSDVLNSSQIKDDNRSVNAINSDIDACSQSTLSADEDDFISPISEQILPKQEADAYEDNEFNRMLQETLDGFLLILTSDGDIAYVTDNVSDYLGITKVCNLLTGFLIISNLICLRLIFWVNQYGSMLISAIMLNLKIY